MVRSIGFFAALVVVFTLTGSAVTAPAFAETASATTDDVTVAMGDEGKVNGDSVSAEKEKPSHKGKPRYPYAEKLQSKTHREPPPPKKKPKYKDWK
ncbi:MAG: hypothetical protein PVF33_07975, partial [Candidatus Latescibacterota bacterium]